MGQLELLPQHDHDTPSPWWESSPRRDGTLPGGIACDDGAAAHFVDDTLTEVIADRPTSVAYRVVKSAASGVSETPLKTRFLDDDSAPMP